jgi:hypothetical protein
LTHATAARLASIAFGLASIGHIESVVLFERQTVSTAFGLSARTILRRTTHDVG